jgi:transposase InsO family protein
VIYRFKNKYPVKDMCKFLEVSRSGYYDWIKRLNVSDKDERLANIIRICQEKCKRTYGYRRVRLWLTRNHGMVVNHKALLRIMNKYDLLSEVRRRRRYHQYSQSIHRYENILNRDFKAERPNQKWVTDITYIHTKQGVMYLSAIKDLYDDFIIDYKYGSEQAYDLVSKTIRSAVKKIVAADGLVLHSDQGAQYTSHEYHCLTKEYGIIPSMSRRGNCLDNACVENFFGQLKSECINRVELTTLEETQQLIDEYIYFYNFERIQLKTKLTPYEKRCQSA